MRQVAFSAAHGVQLNVVSIAQRIGIALSDWPGNCYAVSCQMVKCKVVKGRPAYGNYHGPVAPGSMFFGKPIVRHGWIRRPDETIVDPTRWVFEGAEPYIYEGQSSIEYDEGANLLRARYARPAPIFDPNKQMVEVPNGEIRELIAGLLGMGEVRAEINTEQAFWLGNMSLQALGENAGMVYGALTDMGMQVFVPVDNYARVMERWSAPACGPDGSLKQA